MKSLYYILALCFILLIVGACIQGEDPEPYPDGPILHNIRVSQDSIRQFRDSAYLEIEYEDATGDVGFSSIDQKSLWLKDSRLEEADLYHVAPLAPDEVEVHIQGTLRINLGNLFLLSNDKVEEIVYKAKIRDRAGNWSEEIVADTLFLIR